MSNSEDQAKFWRLVEDYEKLTRRETVAIRHRDYVGLGEAQRIKSMIFPSWHQLGVALGLNRLNCPELRLRLDAISASEEANLQAIRLQRGAAQKRLVEVAAARQRARSVGKNYQPERRMSSPTPAFAARV